MRVQPSQALFDSMLCMQFPALVRWAVQVIDPRTGEVIHNMDAVRFIRRSHAEWWVERASPLTIAEYRIVPVKASSPR